MKFSSFLKSNWNTDFCICRSRYLYCFKHASALLLFGDICKQCRPSLDAALSYFPPLINVKMPTIVGILTFMSGKNFMLSWVEHEKSFITSGPDLWKIQVEFYFLLNRKFIIYSPIGVAEWENPIHEKRCWQSCVDQPRLGDVIASNGHVGIVTGPKLATRSSLEATPPGLIVENDWGFRAGQTPVCWRYKYNTPWCYYFKWIRWDQTTNENA